MHRLLLALLGVIALCACGRDPAQQPPPARAWDDPDYVASGDWVLYYAALRTSDLAPELAKEYGVATDPSRSLVVVSLKHGAADAPPETPVSITVRTLDGLERPVAVQRIERGGARSWIGVFASGGRELITFSVTARPEANEPAITADFRRELFSD
jgi:Domain of unknown function (DUF4426)